LFPRALTGLSVIAFQAAAIRALCSSSTIRAHYHDSDFAYLCRKLRERGASICIVGEVKTPSALRNASDQFFEWTPDLTMIEANADAISIPTAPHEEAPRKLKDGVKLRPLFVVEAVKLLSSDTAEGKVSLGTLGQYRQIRTHCGRS
jgi:hypothetical protein